MGTLDVNALLAERFGVVEVELAGLGTVKVRPLTRAEALKLRGVELDPDEMERRLIALAMVEPEMTEEQVQKWQEVSPAGELEPVGEAIIRISGMEKTSGKQAYADFRE
jgi:hypothetical protein